MSAIVRMKLRDILDQVNLIIRENDIVYFCEDMAVIEGYRELYAMEPKDRLWMTRIREFLIANEKHIDKENFILLTVYNYKDNIEKLEEEKSRLMSEFDKKTDAETLMQISEMHIEAEAQRKHLKKAIKLGKGVEACLTFYCYNDEKERFEVEVVDSKEVIEDQKRSEHKKLQRFDELDALLANEKENQDFGIEYILQAILLTDLYEVFPNRTFGDEIRTMILENEILRKGIRTEREISELKTQRRVEEYIELIESSDFKDMLPSVKHTLREYVKYLDLDRLLVLSAYRLEDGLEKGYIDPKLYMGVKEILDVILKSIKPNYQDNRPFVIQDKGDSYNEIEVNYSVKDIKKCLRRFTSSRYLTKQDVEEYRQKIASGEMSLVDLDDECISVLFSQAEIEKHALLSEDNFIYVVHKLSWEREKVLACIKSTGHCSSDLALNLIANNKIEIIDLVDLYENGKITLAELMEIKDTIDLSEGLSFEKLNDYYKLTRLKLEDEEAKENYRKYLELYKGVLIDETTEKSKDASSNRLIEHIIENCDGKEYFVAIKNYYKEGMLTLSSILEWESYEMIDDLYNDGLVSVDEILDLAKQNKVPFEYISKVFSMLVKQKDLDYDTRLEYIKKGYVSEKDIIDLYNQNLIFEKDLEELSKTGIIREDTYRKAVNSRTREELEKNSTIRLIGLNRLKKKNNEIYGEGSVNGGYQVGSHKPKEIIDPNTREEYIYLFNACRAETDLDEESPFYNYVFYAIPDESGEIGLNSVVIAERYYEDKETETKFATNNATYFFRYRDLMVLSNLKKSEMTKDRKDIVFTAKHSLATDEKGGRWAASVIYGIAKTMLGSNLDEYSSENQRIIVMEQLHRIYTDEEIRLILDLGIEIDDGQYNCEIIDDGRAGRRKGRSVSSDDNDQR